MYICRAYSKTGWTQREDNATDSDKRKFKFVIRPRFRNFFRWVRVAVSPRHQVMLYFEYSVDSIESNGHMTRLGDNKYRNYPNQKACNFISFSGSSFVLLASGFVCQTVSSQKVGITSLPKFGFSWYAWFSNSFLLGAKCEAMTLGAMLCALEKRCSTIASSLASIPLSTLKVSRSQIF